jgi:transposase
VQAVIQQQFGIYYNVHYLIECLQRFGWSVRKPTDAARERNHALVET